MLGAQRKSLITSVFVGLATQMQEAYRAGEKAAVAAALSVIEKNKMRLQKVKKGDRRRSNKKKKGSHLLFFFLFSARALRFLPRAA
jgi:hypothetical protein